MESHNERNEIVSLFSFSFENQLSLWYVRVMSTFYIVIWLSSFAIAPHAVWCKILLLKILTKQGNNKVSVTVKRNKYNLKSKTIWILNGAHWNDTLNLFIVKCKVLNFHSLSIVLSKRFFIIQWDILQEILCESVISVEENLNAWLKFIVFWY